MKKYKISISRDAACAFYENELKPILIGGGGAILLLFPMALGFYENSMWPFASYPIGVLVWMAKKILVVKRIDK